MVEGSDAQQTILGVEDGGRQVRVRASSSSSGAGRLVAQSDVHPIHPSASDKNIAACFLFDVQSANSVYAAGDRRLVLSTFGDNVLVADNINSDEPDMLTTEEFKSMCKCADMGTAEPAGKKAKGKASKKGGKKK